MAKRILFVCNEYPPRAHGGQGIIVRDLAEKLAEGNRSVFVVAQAKDIVEKKKFNQGGVIVNEFPGIEYKAPWFFGILLDRFVFASRLKKFIKENRIDVVEFPDAGLLTLFWNAPIPTFVRLHNGDRYLAEKKRGKLYGWIERISLKKIFQYIAVSNFIKSEFQNFFGFHSSERSIEVIYNGIELHGSSNNGYEKGKLTFAGTLKPIKGLETLISAFISLKNNYPELKLNIYGRDQKFQGESYAGYLIKKFELQSLVDRKDILFHGVAPKKELLNEFANSELNIFPSIKESFGLVAIEAMDVGGLVIFTKMGAGPEIINDGEDGFLVDPESTEHLRSTMEKAMSLPLEQRVELTSNAQSKVKENFSIASCASKSLELYGIKK